MVSSQLRGANAMRGGQVRAQLEQRRRLAKLFVCAYVGARGSWISPLARLLDRVFAQAIAEDSELEDGGVSEGMLRRQRRVRRDLEEDSGGGEKRA